MIRKDDRLPLALLNKKELSKFHFLKEVFTVLAEDKGYKVVGAYVDKTKSVIFVVDKGNGSYSEFGSPLQADEGLAIVSLALMLDRTAEKMPNEEESGVVSGGPISWEEILRKAEELKQRFGLTDEHPPLP